MQTIDASNNLLYRATCPCCSPDRLSVSPVSALSTIQAADGGCQCERRRRPTSFKRHRYGEPRWRAVGERGARDGVVWRGVWR